MLQRPQKHQIPADPPESASRRRPAGGASSSSAPGNVDKYLFKNLVEMVPLVESLMDRRATTSFRRRASVVYTAAPSQPKKVTSPSGRKTTQSVSAKKRRSVGDHNNVEGAADDFSILSSKVDARNIQKDMEELALLQEQVADLHKKLSERDEALKSAEDTLNQMNVTHKSLDELRNQVKEKDSLIKSTNSQLYNAKIKLADKQSALKKLEWEASMSNRKVEELQGSALSMEFEVTALMKLFQELSKDVSPAHPDAGINSVLTEQLPHVDNIDMEKMEEARTAYVAAVAVAKENPSEESIAAAAEARQRLQAFVL